MRARDFPRGENVSGGHDHVPGEGMICPYVFPRSGGPIKGFVKVWKSACQTAGCPGKLPHDFRRTAIATWSALAYPRRRRW